MFRWHVVSAVFWRNVKQYFSGPLGYLFIVVFVSVCSVMAFTPRFFADNLANLDQLSRWFPVLLLFFIPAITMTVWADEKRQGTDSILFTLPASDFDILLGKYLSVAAVYTVALLFSMAQLIVLTIIGDPDWGVIATTYFGYWLAGLALLSVGMFASSLTSSATVAFVLGSILCAVPVLIGHYARGHFGWERLGFDWNLRDFTIGLLPFSNVVYFLALTIFMLYLNLIVISRRHWHRGQQLSLGSQYLVRALSLGVALAAGVYLCNTAISSMWTRADLTHEKLYTLDAATVDTLNSVKKNDRAVTIQAFISRDVPRKYVNTKKQLVGLLRQFGEFGGSNVSVRFVDVTPNSQEALEATQSGIQPQDDRSEIGGRTVEQQVFLGATIATSLDDVTIPFVDNDSSIEYELTRALATTVDKRQKITLGIVDTDSNFAGAIYQGERVDWAYGKTIDTLEQLFKIKHIAQSDLKSYVDAGDPKDSPRAEEAASAGGLTDSPADAEATKGEQKTAAKKLDVLLVPDPSSLDDGAMQALVEYIESGQPTIILADPLPFYWASQDPQRLGVFNAPKQPRVSQNSPYGQLLTSSSEPKSDNGTAEKLLKAIGVQWNNGSAAWSLNNPHPSFQGKWLREYLGARWPEYYGPREKAFVFARSDGNFQSFNDESLISSGLKELLFFYPGSIRKSVDSKTEFQPLVSLSNSSGVTSWEELTMTPFQRVPELDPRSGELTVTTQRASSQITGDDLVVLNPTPYTTIDDQPQVLAARITGGEHKIDVVMITDLDFVSDLAYEQEAELQKTSETSATEGLTLDNLSLLQNAIEVLADNTEFVALRNRRPRPRTLVKLESVFENFREERANQQAEAEKKVRDELSAAQEKLDDATSEISQDQSLSFFEKLQKTSQEATDSQRRFDLKKRKLERNLKQKISELETEEQNRISTVERSTRYTSIFTAPLPALILGCIVLWLRYHNEQKNIAPQRRVQK